MAAEEKGGIPTTPTQKELIDPLSNRGKVDALVKSTFFEVIMSVMILLNVVLMIIETDAHGICVSEGKDATDCDELWVTIVNICFLAVYSVEGILRLFAERLQFFRSFWNVLDALILICGWGDTLLVFTVGQFPGPSATLLRILRIARLVRILRLISVFPELYELVRGFLAAMMAMFWGFVMIVVFVIIFSIISVEVLNPINVTLSHDTDYCHDAFTSVWNCMMMFIQTLVAGDSWGACAIPIIQHSKWSSVIFVTAMIFIQLGATNLILAVIVERANRAHELDVENQIKVRAKEHAEAAKTLRQDLKDIDVNKSGTISIRELEQGFDDNQSLHRQLLCLDLERHDLSDLFSLMDECNDGELEYEELVDTILSATLGDFRKQIMMLRLKSNEIGRLLHKNTQDMDSIRKMVGAAPTKRKSQTGLVLEPSKSNISSSGGQSANGDMRKQEVKALSTQSTTELTQHVFDGHIKNRKEIKELERGILRTIDSWASRHFEREFAVDVDAYAAVAGKDRGVEVDMGNPQKDLRVNTNELVHVNV